MAFPVRWFPVIMTRNIAFVIFCCAVGFINIFFAPRAQAHQTAMSSLNVEIRPESREVDMLLAVSAEDLASFLKLSAPTDGYLDATKRAGLQPHFLAYLSPKMRALNGGENCPLKTQGFVAPEESMSAVFFRKTLVCERVLGDVSVVNRVMLEAPDGYTHYGQIQLGKDVHTTVFNPDNPRYTVAVVEGAQNPVGATKMADQSVLEVVSDFAWLGVLHIVLGLDHVLFVLCLLLAAGDFRRLIKVVSYFTLAHSITLVISSLDIFSVAPSVVEPLIALSIIWVAVEIFWAQRASASDRSQRELAAPTSNALVAGKHLFLLTFMFGLLHGFGFSYVLRDEIGLPTESLVAALFSFNLGVELGQVAVVCVAFPLIIWMRRQPWGRRGIQAISAGVFIVALFWFVTRLPFF